MTRNDLQIGWFGKLPCVGDFIRSRLSPQFISDWDGWMQAMMLTARETLAENWHACYMAAPIWRFALPPNICGHYPAAGIVMPSVDRVGRQYPFCLVVEGRADTFPKNAWCGFQGLEPIYETLENIALSMLEDGSSIEMLEKELAAVPVDFEAHVCGHTRHLGNGTLSVSEKNVENQMALLAARPGSTLWVAVFEETNRTLLCRGMPEGQDLAVSLFDLAAPVWSKSPPAGTTREILS